MDKSKKVKLSKALSYILRHGAKKHGFMVFEGGWVYLDDVLEWLNRREKNSVKRRDVYYVVKHNEKNRFSIKENLIRANQGHTFPVNLQLKERTPPELLYHGTHEKVKNKILEKGILRMKRHHVHLSDNLLTAKKVGARRGKPVIFEVDAKGMQEAGYIFYLSANNVWLTKRVPPAFVKILPDF